MPQAKAGHIIKLPTFATLVRRHSKACMAQRLAFWRLNDRPAAMRAGVQVIEMWAEGPPTFCTREDLDAAVEAHNMKQRAKRPRSNQSVISEERLTEYRERLESELKREQDKNRSSGHSTALAAHALAENIKLCAWRALLNHIGNHGTALEAQKFINYMNTANNNDFGFHVLQYQNRRTNRPKVPLPEFNHFLLHGSVHRSDALNRLLKVLNRLASSGGAKATSGKSGLRAGLQLCKAA